MSPEGACRPGIGKARFEIVSSLRKIPRSEPGDFICGKLVLYAEIRDREGRIGLVAKSAAGNNGTEPRRARSRSGCGVVYCRALRSGGSVRTSRDFTPGRKARSADALARGVGRTVHVELEYRIGGTDSDASRSRNGQSPRIRHSFEDAESAGIRTDGHFATSRSDAFEHELGCRIRCGDVQSLGRIRRSDSYFRSARHRNRGSTQSDILDVVDEFVPHRGVEIGRASGTGIRVISRRKGNERRASYGRDRYDRSERHRPQGRAAHDGNRIFGKHIRGITLREVSPNRFGSKGFYSGEMHAPSRGHPHVH